MPGITRREFGKRFAAFVTGLAIPQVLSELGTPTKEKTVLSTQPEQHEHLPTVEWKREEYLQNPLPLIDTFYEKAIIWKSDFIQETLALVCDKPENQERRKAIAAVYRQVSTQLLELSEQLDAMANLDSGDPNHYHAPYNWLNSPLFYSVWQWWAPLDQVATMLGDPSGGHAIPEQKTWNNIAEWCLPCANVEKKESQRDQYRSRGQKMMAESPLWENVEEVWTHLMRLNRSGDPNAPLAEERWRTNQGLKIFVNTLIILNETFPCALTGVETIDFTSHVGHRAYYTDYPNTHSIFLGQDYNYAVQQLKTSSIIKPEDEQLHYEYEYAIRLNAENNNRVLLHELSHHYDLWNRFLPINSHPADFLELAQVEVKAVNSFLHQLPKMTGEELQLWFFDQETPKYFGIDQIINKGQLKSFTDECQLLIDIQVELNNVFNNNPEELKWVKENVPAFSLWQSSDQKLLFWRLFLGEMPVESPEISKLANDELIAYQKGMFEGKGFINRKIYDYSVVDDLLLCDIQGLAEELWEKRYYQPMVCDSLLGVLLLAKQFCLLSLFAVLEALRQAGKLKTPAYQQPGGSLEVLYSKVFDLCVGHVLHTLEGPIGEYFPTFGQFPSMQVDQRVSADNMVYMLGEARYDQRRNLEAAGFPPEQTSLSEETITMLDKWYMAVPNAMEKRAVVWGGHGLNDYIRFNNRVCESPDTFNLPRYSSGK